MYRKHLDWLLICLMVICVACFACVTTQGTTAPAETPPSAIEGTESPSNLPEQVKKDADPEEDLIEDGGGEDQQVCIPLPCDQPLPFTDLSDEEIRTALKSDKSVLGPMSIGFTNSGALMNAVQMPQGAMWSIVNSRETWGTQETIDYVIKAIAQVNMLYADTPPLYIGDMSDSNGGPLNRHVSHQAGRDVDIGFYYKGGKGTWYTPGSSRNMDLPRNWAFVRSLLVHTDVELILVSKSIQRSLYSYALSIGEDRQWLDSVFQYPGGRSGRIIRYSKGHHTHYHVRFYNLNAQEMGRRAYPQLLKLKMIKPPTYYVKHRVRSGETLGHIARRYRSSVSAIKRANGLRSNLIRAGRTYRIPKRGGVRRVPEASIPPQRKLPVSTPEALALANWTPSGQKSPSLRHSIVVAKMQPTNDGVVKKANKKSSVVKTRPDSAKRAVYKVKRGDSLWIIANKNGVTVDEINQWNDLKTTKLLVGQRLVLENRKPAPAKKKAVTYKVRSGDTLWGIAKANHVAVNDIRKWNRLKSDSLHIGQKLALYPNGKSKTGPAKIKYRVRSGDNLWTIARSKDIHVADIKRWNSLKSDNLRIGQVLILHIKN